MKYILLVFMGASLPQTLLAHDGSSHIATTWPQELTLTALISGLVLTGTLLVGAAYSLPRYRKVFAGIGLASVLIGFAGWQLQQTPTTPVAPSVVANLTDLPVTVYRTEGCSCCTGFADELNAVGAEVTVTTITPTEMHTLKRSHGISSEQESCHTSVIDEYVVEGHVPFAAISQLVETRPAITGITLPGMPIGTPGMPGTPTEVHTVTTLADEPFWRSS